MALDNGSKLGQLATKEDGRQLCRKSTALARASEGGDDAAGGEMHERAALVPVRAVAVALETPNGGETTPRTPTSRPSIILAVNAPRCHARAIGCPARARTRR